MSILGFDYETKSSLDIAVGARKYLRTPESGIVCLSYKVDDYPTQLWIPGQRFPYRWTDFETCYAFNAQFDWQVTNVLGPKYNIPPLPLNKVTDVMALCGRYGYPQSLDMAGKALGLKIRKDPKGKRLMKKICSPPFEYTEKELHDFYLYCVTDTDTMHEMLHALPASRLSEEEQRVWEMTVGINKRGLPVDTLAINRIKEIVDYFKKKQSKRVPIITGGAIQTTNQTKAIIKWCEEVHEVFLPDCTAGTVKDVLKDEDLPEEVRDLLELRQLLSKSSLAKYNKLQEQEHDGRIYANLRYYAGHTGRYGGLGFQIHNLPRKCADNPEEQIEKFFDTTILKEDVMTAAKELIRPMIYAPKGKVMVVGDYKSIENIFLMWLADEWETLELIRDGLDPYIDFGTSLFQKQYDQITDDERGIAKVVVLGAGYNMSGGAFYEYQAGYGIGLTRVDSEAAIKVYRKRFAKVKKLWYALRDAAIDAVTHKGQEFQANRVTFKVVVDRNGRQWLRMGLPSGRPMFYEAPRVEADKYGNVVTHMGTNPYSKKWSRLKLIPGRITENVDQAISRDYLNNGKFHLLGQGYSVNGSVHDEIICEEDESFDRLPHFLKTMCINPDWCKDVPMVAEGYISKRYKKG